MKQTPFNGSRGFTLLELIAVVGIIAFLATLLYPTLKTAVIRADQSAGINKLRSIGQAMMLYTGDHDGYLPGPLWPGQMIEYDPNREGRLVRELAPYLGYPESNETYLAKDFASKMLLSRTPAAALPLVRPYVLNLDCTNASGELVRPFGNLAASEPGTPMKHVNLPPEIRAQWMMSDADQAHPRVLGASWRAYTPTKPIYGKSRNALFYDLHAEILPLNAF